MRSALHEEIIARARAVASGADDHLPEGEARQLVQVEIIVDSDQVDPFRDPPSFYDDGSTPFDDLKSPFDDLRPFWEMPDGFKAKMQAAEMQAAAQLQEETQLRPQSQPKRKPKRKAMRQLSQEPRTIEDEGYWQSVFADADDRMRGAIGDPEPSF